MALVQPNPFRSWWPMPFARSKCTQVNCLALFSFSAFSSRPLLQPETLLDRPKREKRHSHQDVSLASRFLPPCAPWTRVGGAPLLPGAHPQWPWGPRSLRRPVVGDGSLERDRLGSTQSFRPGLPGGGQFVLDPPALSLGQRRWRPKQRGGAGGPHLCLATWSLP